MLVPYARLFEALADSRHIPDVMRLQCYGGGEAGLTKNLFTLTIPLKPRKCQQPSPPRLLNCMNLHLNKAHRADPSGSFIIAGGTYNAV